MTENLIKADLVMGGKMSVIDYICEISASDCTDGPDDLKYWEMVRDAQKNGKKLIFINGPAPLEIIYALDCVPLYLDLIPSRLSGNDELTARLINVTETRANCALCSLQKTNMGILISKNLGLEPAAYVTLPIPCDSARTACTELGRYMDVQVFHFDIPLQKNEKTLGYIEAQLVKLIEFLEEVTGKRLDWGQLKYRAELYNRSAELLRECAGLRAVRPCPLSSRMTVWNEMMNAFGPTEEMVQLLESETALCRERAEKGFSPCPEGEKHRVLIIHNLLRQAAGLTSMLERDYGAVTVADGFCFEKRESFAQPDDRQDCLRVMSRRMQEGSMAHGAGVSGEELLRSIEALLHDFKPDVFIFLGNRGCRHAWAATKVVSDTLQKRYGMPMLMLDVDNTDFRYKSEKEIKILISEYMDTVINKK